MALPENSMTLFEPLAKRDIDRILSAYLHEARHKLVDEQARVVADVAAQGALQSNRVILVAIDAADKIHIATIKEVLPMLRDFVERMAIEPTIIVEWARPHLQNLNNSLLGVIKPNGFPADRERLVRQYGAVFQQRTEGLLRDLEIGYVRGAGFSARAKMLDQNEWITAAEAMKLVGAVMGKQMAAEAICSRARDGLIAARAIRFIKAGEASNNVNVPAEFWWAGGHEALTQNWVSGDFETWINHGVVQLKAYGVTFRRADIERLLPGQSEKQNDVSGPQSHAKADGTMPNSNRVFVVHGREEGPREAVARFLSKIGLEPIILHEQANQSQTVIEKIEAYSDVGFAVVLLTPDDEGNLKGEAPQPRARQNVLLELGYFIGKLTRKRVCTLKSGEIEIPSDWRGIIDEPFDGGWQKTLARELKAAGYEIDWNKVMQ